MRKNFKQVRPEDFNVELLLAAAQEGRLYVDDSRLSYSPEGVKDKVRAYVARISPFVSPRYCSVVDQVWNDIFDNDLLMPLLMPKPKARKCRDFDKYGVMRIVCVLREKGIYEQRSDPQFDALLEGKKGDSPYRRFLSQGLENHQQVVALRKITERFNILVK